MEKINEEQLQLFEDQPIRSAWDEENEEWYFSIVDIVGILTEQADYDGARNYWKVTKHRMIKEGSELVTNCNQLKLKAADGKRRLTDVANTEQLLRIIQSIPSKKAEPFKLWLAQVGRERIEETIDPELIADDTKAWSGMTTRQYKTYKGLKKESLRDNMSTTELVLNMLAETATKDISKEVNPNGLEENREIAKQGGEVAATARAALEKRTGKPVVTKQNATQLNHVVSTMIEASANTVER